VSGHDGLSWAGAMANGLESLLGGRPIVSIPAIADGGFCGLRTNGNCGSAIK